VLKAKNRRRNDNFGVILRIDNKGVNAPDAMMEWRVMAMPRTKRASRVASSEAIAELMLGVAQCFIRQLCTFPRQLLFDSHVAPLQEWS
jgi:hypothetical protein